MTTMMMGLRFLLYISRRRIQIVKCKDGGLMIYLKLYCLPYSYWMDFFIFRLSFIFFFVRSSKKKATARESLFLLVLYLDAKPCFDVTVERTIVGWYKVSSAKRNWSQSKVWFRRKMKLFIGGKTLTFFEKLNPNIIFYYC